MTHVDVGEGDPIVFRPFLSWDEWPETTREFFKAQRGPMAWI